MTWIVVVVVVVALLGFAALMDMRSRKIRGRSFTMRLPSRAERRTEARMSRRNLHGDYNNYRARRPGEDVHRAD